MNRSIPILLCLLIFISCDKEDSSGPIVENGNQEFLSAVDISRYPEIASTNPTFYDLEGNPKGFLPILKENGINTVRLRLWVNPIDEHSGFNEVKQFSQTLRGNGFKTWLTLHYSDTWADPGNQKLPTQWQNLDFNTLKDSVHLYTKKVMDEIRPDYIQIGNEINSGILHPYGNISTNYQNFRSLIQEGCAAVRENSEDCKIILHFAGIENSDWFFDQVIGIDYDIIGLSYYPIWHGHSLNDLQSKMQQLANTHNKEILIAETAYPFTLEWNDWTHNIVGLEEQLILPEYPATPEGQRKFVKEIKTITQELEKGIGFCYWGSELIAWKGKESTDASPWENQALFDFTNKALPVLNEFKIE
ncbi:arabinogalactan endo-1,4-beta-galactosidase [Muricauda sp. SCSIO 64092]|uniref:glycoside hydrolase family 53 protein n=1 Tax=Allomuricauda sp. SCSIO 64092 TaxID=2908842 RepID=UPI001FF3FC94|nr:glycosyl hydrolase 53 family protein [Muricauda sp. SCSIO 64092]UOY07311.1 arabinogalactan endo-1,4-beta-galactosidase [Muricauda sp. SCSIO 64092]